jgi:RNA polymerase sigma-70 factor (ECF subfamily)
MQNVCTLPLVARTPSKGPVQKTPDQALIGLIAAGDKRAMELLFARHSVRVYRFALRLTGNVSLAEDIVSEVFLQVWRGAGAFKAKCQVSTWLLAIAHHKAVSAIRRRPHAQLDEAVAAGIADTADNPEITAHHVGRNAIMQQCLKRLVPAHREVIDLVYYHEKSVAEVAQIVGIPPSTVKTRMFHARARLSQLLETFGIRGFQAD